MIYTIKAHPTTYNGTQFRSRLEARWAAFADIVGWKWEYEPIDLDGWTPDFKFTLPCGHSECDGAHELYAEVKPYTSLEQFNGHAVTRFDPYQLPSPAVFGANPSVTRFEFCHGHGGGVWKAVDWVDRPINVDQAWAEAGNRTRYQAAA